MEVKLKLRNLLLISLILFTFILTGCLKLVLDEEWDLEMDGKYDQAITLLEEKTSNPASNECSDIHKWFDQYKHLIDLYNNRGHYDKAIITCEKFIKLLDADPYSKCFRPDIKLLWKTDATNNALRASLALNDISKSTQYANSLIRYVRHYERKQENLSAFDREFNYKTKYADEYKNLLLYSMTVNDKKKSEYYLSKLSRALDMNIDDNLDNFEKEIGSIGIFGGPGKLETLSVMSLYYYNIGRYDIAIKMLKFEIKNEKVLRLKGHLLLFPIMGFYGYNIPYYDKELFLAKCLYKAEKYEDAYKIAKKLSQSLSSANIKYYSDAITWELNKLMGDLLYNKKDYENALEYYQRSVDQIEKTRATVTNVRHRILYFETKNELYESTIKLLVLLKQHEKALLYAERSKARSFLDLVGNKFIASNNNNANNIINKINNNEYEIKNIMANIDQDDEMKQESIRKISIKGKEIKELSSQLSDNYPEIASNIAVVSIPLGKIQRIIDKNTKLIEYYVGKNTTYVWTIGKSSINFCELDVKEAELEELVQKVTDGMHDRTKKRYTEKNEKLYNLLFKPVEKYISHSDRICIIGHSYIHNLPFQALHSKGTYLLEKYRIFYAPSAATYYFIKLYQRPKKLKILAIGNPNSALNQMNLPYAEVEVKNIKKLYPESTVFIGNEANKTNLLNSIGNSGIIHFATHALFNSYEPMKSGLCLSSKEQKVELLTAEEINTLNLDAYLVVLSACDTAKGKITKSDELLSLTRSFMISGSSSVISTLWKVDDEATTFLITKFYEELKANEKIEALRVAQIETMKKYKSPYYWGAFILAGDWN